MTTRKGRKRDGRNRRQNGSVGGGRRKQESDERLAVPQLESVEARRVESVGNAYAETGKQDDGAIESGESAGTEGSSEHIEGQDWKDILYTASGYKTAEDVDKVMEEEDTFYSVFALEDMPLMQRLDPELAMLDKGLEKNFND